MRRHPDAELLATETLFRGRVFDLVRVRLPSGLEQELVVVHHPGAVAVAAVQEDGRLLCVRQYRHDVGAWLVEIPAGRLEPGESPLAAAQRELEEETGHRAARWRELGGFYAAPGFCSERMTIFEARGLAPVGGERRAADADEEIELVPLAPRELLAGASPDAKTLVAAAILEGSVRPS
jgi:ADP-ribose pyrophosphatase